MKLIKMLGLAVVAAAAMTALLGAGTASATMLCTAHPEVVIEGGKEVEKCKTGTVYGNEAGKKIKLHLKGISYLKTQNTAQETLVECNESQPEGTTTTGGPQSPQVEGQLELAPFTNNGGKCPGSFGNVKVTVLNLPWHVWATWEGQTLGQEGKDTVGWGEIHLEGKEGKKMKFELEGAFGVRCVYEPKNVPLQGEFINGGVNAPESQVSQVHFGVGEKWWEKASFKLQEGNPLFCPESGHWEAHYEVKGENAAKEQIDLYIAKE